MTILIGLLVCRPIEKNWDPTAVGTCGDQIAAYTAVSIYNVVVDVVMCLMPIPVRLFDYSPLVELPCWVILGGTHV